jgi:hypothetical protein
LYTIGAISRLKLVCAPGDPPGTTKTRIPKSGLTSTIIDYPK